MKGKKNNIVNLNKINKGFANEVKKNQKAKEQAEDLTYCMNVFNTHYDNMHKMFETPEVQNAYILTMKIRLNAINDEVYTKAMAAISIYVSSLYKTQEHKYLNDLVTSVSGKGLV